MKIVLLYEFLRYDIEQLIHRYAKSIEDMESRYEAEIRTDDDNDFSEQDMMMRLITTGCSRVRAVVMRYLENKVGDADDKLSDEESWEYDFKPTVIADGQMLAELMHWMVVRYAIAAWCKMRGALEASESEMAEAQLQGEMLTEALKRSKMPMKQGKRMPVPEDIITIFYNKNEEG